MTGVQTCALPIYEEEEVEEQEASGPEERSSPKQEAQSPELKNQEQLTAFPEEVREVNKPGNVPEERAVLIIGQQDGAQSGGVQNVEHAVLVEEGVEAIDDGLQVERLASQNIGEPVVQNHERSRKGSKSSNSVKKGKGRQRKQDGAKEETELQCSLNKPQSTGCGALERRLPVTGLLVGLTPLGLSLPPSLPPYRRMSMRLE